MPLPDVGWGGRGTSGLSHEQIHRWIAGADPVALAAARDEHAARGAELRAVADRLDRSRAAASENWQGRDADAAARRVRTVRARLQGLSDAVADQARSLDGIRAATERVQAAVGPPRPPALGPLAGPPAATGLPAVVTGGSPDGFAAFRSAQSEEAAAREAYRAYLDDTAAAARAAPGGGAAVPGTGPAIGAGSGSPPGHGSPAGHGSPPGVGSPDGSGSGSAGSPSGPASPGPARPGAAPPGSRAPGAGRSGSWNGVLARAARVGPGTGPGGGPGALAAPPAHAAAPAGTAPGAGARVPVPAGSGPGPAASPTVRAPAPAPAHGSGRPGTGSASGDGSRPGARPDHLVPADPHPATDPDEAPRFVAPPVLGAAPVAPEEDR